MGLDITAYRRLQPDPHGSITIDPEEQFPGRLQGLAPRKYACSADDQFDFRAGSYSGYNAWRDELAKMAGYPSAEYVWYRVTKGPFLELINFSDCEGFIGPETAAKLARDFAEYQAKAEELGDYFLGKYEDFRKACEYAADGGAIQFS
jgi:hypothetical protein